MTLLRGAFKNKLCDKSEFFNQRFNDKGVFLLYNEGNNQ